MFKLLSTNSCFLNSLTKNVIRHNLIKHLSRANSSDNKIKPISVDDKTQQTQLYEKKEETNQSDTQQPPFRKPFKYYFDSEERDKTKIVYYEEFFDQNTKLKDRKNFMVIFLVYSYLNINNL